MGRVHPKRRNGQEALLEGGEASKRARKLKVLPDPTLLILLMAALVFLKKKKNLLSELKE